MVFDYPDEKIYTDRAAERAKKQVAMAGAAGEKMFANYSCDVLEKYWMAPAFLSVCLTPEEMTARYFKNYDTTNPEHETTALDDVNYCLAVRK